MKNITVKILVVILTFVIGVELENLMTSYNNSIDLLSPIPSKEYTSRNKNTTLAMNQTKVDSEREELSISIAIPKHGGDRSIIYSSTSDHFSVVITNTSNQPQKVWKEWCSWGYFSLWFEVEEEGGRKYEVHKKGRAWFRNYPDAWTIAPGENLVIDVYFGSNDWDNFPLPKDGKPKKVKLTAIFENGHDEEIDKELLKLSNCEDIWLGKISSSPSDFFVYNYKH